MWNANFVGAAGASKCPPEFRVTTVTARNRCHTDGPGMRRTILFGIHCAGVILVGRSQPLSLRNKSQ